MKGQELLRDETNILFDFKWDCESTTASHIIFSALLCSHKDLAFSFVQSLYKRRKSEFNHDRCTSAVTQTMHVKNECIAIQSFQLGSINFISKVTYYLHRAFAW